MWSYNPNLTGDEVLVRLTGSARDLGDPNKDPYYGHGLVDAYRAITLWGPIASDTTWGESGGPTTLYVSGDITIPSGKTLTINRGTTIKIAADNEASGSDTARVQIIVEGSLQIASGTGQVTFESIEESPSAYDWQGILLTDSSPGNVLDGVVVRHAIKGIDVRTTEDVPTIKNALIEYCDIGMSVEEADSVYVENSTIRACLTVGLDVMRGSTVRFDGGMIEDLNYGAWVRSEGFLYVRGGATIQDTYVGITVAPDDSSRAHADIKSSTLKNNGIGVYADSIVVTNTPGGVLTEGVMVRECTITNDSPSGTSIGIYCNNQSNIRIILNTIEKQGVGIFCNDSSSPKIKNVNEITDNGTGIQCDDSSHPLIRNNIITGDTIGVTALDDSDPDLGDSGSSSPGNNAIHTSASFHVVNTTIGLTLKAEGNFWNETISPCFPKANKISGSVDYDPSLCSDPQAFMVELVPKDDLPSTFGLDQNYPNPFNPITTIRYRVPDAGSEVEILIYNVRGQLVKELVHDFKSAGYYTARWDGTNELGEGVASGVYLIRMHTNDFTETRKVVFTK